MKPDSLEALYSKLTPAAGAPPLGQQREVGHFNVFNVADLMLTSRDRPPMTFDRRAFYKISLIRGRSRIEYADQAVEVTGCALWFASHRVPYRWLPHDQEQAGHFCVFTQDFLLPAQGGIGLAALSVFQPGGCPVMPLAAAEFTALEALLSE